MLTKPIVSRRRPQRYVLTALLGLILLFGHLQLDTRLPLSSQWTLLDGRSALSFDDWQYLDTSLPRAAMAVLVGAALGLSGSLLQQLTQNRLLSPMTIGASSGAWLGLVLSTLYWPALAARHGEWAALGGALLAVLLVLLIAGARGINGLPVVLSGMAINLLLGAVASALVMFHDQYTRHLFIWGAGDLAQSDWRWPQWLWPRLLPAALLVAWLAPRPLMLLRLGGSGAQARGLALWPMMLLLFLAALWLSSTAITAVGLIGFIGLVTPNLARLLGARGARDELLYSALLGAVLLLSTDGIALAFSHWSADVVPSGAAAALVGAPALLWLARRPLSAEDQFGMARTTPQGKRRAWFWPLLLVCCVLLAGLSLTLARGTHGWQWAWPSALVWELRWPRTLAALASGAGLALAGVLLQRLLRNPLASPDILGLSSGATMALLLYAFIRGGPINEAGPQVAFGGCMLVLLALLWLGRRHRYSPAMLALVGISLSALLDAALQFALAKGEVDSFAILGWLAGSTYRVLADQALMLAFGVLLLGGLALLLQRALTLIAIGDGMALARGLPLGRVRLLLLLLAALLCSLVTSVMGPVTFLSLLAPHMATLLGARRVVPQLLLAPLLGGLLMLLADWLGRNLIYPLQMPVGIVASVVCGTYFMLLLLRARARQGGRP
ncbi:Fe(3+)-hydroxamate ABC transporter permease FhuB [Paludibacterium paludis]|uniref:Fe(3+)-hydroxamate ABC transporter permease FhuB n=1 Tax=Paludibacterium paludis TaxID=1225769 RepID=UPI001679CFAD|nr:Fe(3+)-hydroxamate ABC transporter permease FhuB [Paludibacterium paludis]